MTPFVGEREGRPNPWSKISKKTHRTGTYPGSSLRDAVPERSTSLGLRLVSGSVQWEQSTGTVSARSCSMDAMGCEGSGCEYSHQNVTFHAVRAWRGAPADSLFQTCDVSAMPVRSAAVGSFGERGAVPKHIPAIITYRRVVQL